MTAATLLDRLDGVQARGTDRWMAKCPSHPDRSPSLSIRQADDRLLVHCFGGCEVGDVLAAVGLGLGDLYDQPLDHHKSPVRDRRHHHAAREALKAIATEATVLQVAADHLAAGGSLDQADRERLSQAAERIRASREVVA